MSALLLLTSLLSGAVAAPPTHEIPSSVLGELRLLENRFELALAVDCNSARCFSRGCTYVEHEVADRPRSGSLPGLGLDPGPGSVAPQEYLTQAQCGFTHEKSVDGADMNALSRRLQMKLSTGWLVVSINHQELLPLPPELREPPKLEEDSAAPEPEEEVVEPAPQPTMSASEELWAALLPHFFWMLGLLFATLAAVTLLWAWRRVGKDSLEEQALLAQMMQDGGGGADDETPDEAAVVEVSEDLVASQMAEWSARLDQVEAGERDLELEALIRELLRSGEIPLLAKAVLTFPRRFPLAFPSGGDVAAAKLELADFLKGADEATLPSDAELFTALNRHALFAALVSQHDAQIVRSLREDFGTSGLAELIRELPARAGALLFALAPAETQHELVHMLSPNQAMSMAGQLLRSNRLNPEETTSLFGALSAASAGRPVPTIVERAEGSDHGAAFDATGALSVLLPSLGATQRAALFGEARRRFNGSLPGWYRDILTPDMLLALSTEARADLFLSVEVEPLAAWLSLLDAEARAAVLSGMPDSLRRSIEASSVFPSRARQVAMAERSRRELARGFQSQLARARLPFERVVAPEPVGEA